MSSELIVESGDGGLDQPGVEIDYDSDPRVDKILSLLADLNATLDSILMAPDGTPAVTGQMLIKPLSRYRLCLESIRNRYRYRPIDERLKAEASLYVRFQALGLPCR